MADTRRAIEWEAGLRAPVSTWCASRPAADKGDWRIAVAEKKRSEAAFFVSRVLGRGSADEGR